MGAKVAHKIGAVTKESERERETCGFQISETGK